MNDRRKRKGQYSPTKLNPGEMPKPHRLKALCRLANRLHRELLDAQEPTKTIALKDPRTVNSYYETLALYKITLIQVEEMVDFLEQALHGPKKQLSPRPRPRMGRMGDTEDEAS